MFFSIQQHVRLSPKDCKRSWYSSQNSCTCWMVHHCQHSTSHSTSSLINSYLTVPQVSRRPYNQLVTVDYEVNGDAQSAYIGNTWGKTTEVMKDIESTNDLLGIIPQEDPHTLEFNVYHSTQGRIKGEDLKDDRYRSNRLNIITASASLSRVPRHINNFNPRRPTNRSGLLRIFQTTRHIL